MSAEQVLAAALKLPKHSRFKLAQKLFDSAVDDDVLRQGAELAETRRQAMLRGEVGFKPIADVVRSLRGKGKSRS